MIKDLGEKFLNKLQSLFPLISIHDSRSCSYLANFSMHLGTLWVNLAIQAKEISPWLFSVMVCNYCLYVLGNIATWVYIHIDKTW